MVKSYGRQKPEFIAFLLGSIEVRVNLYPREMFCRKASKAVEAAIKSISTYG